MNPSKADALGGKNEPKCEQTTRHKVSFSKRKQNTPIRLRRYHLAEIAGNGPA